MLDSLLELSRGKKKLIAQLIDVVILFVALLLSISLRFGEIYIPQTIDIWASLFVTIMLTIAIGTKLGMYSAVIRFLGHKNVLTICVVIAISAIILTSYLFFFSVQLPRSTPLIYSVLGILLLLGARFSLRLYMQYYATERFGEPVVIYGAGSAGYQLCIALGHDVKYTPVGMVDDNPRLHGRNVHGLKVSSPDKLAELIDEFEVKRVLLAISNISKESKKSLIDKLEKYPVKVKIVPAYSDIISGEAIENLRDVAIDDLLGRDPVEPNNNLLGKCISERVVLVTGAGGSIGSELCRQILKLKPSKLVLFDVSEYALYAIERELQLAEPKLSTNIISQIGSVQDSLLIDDIIQSYQVDTIYHAAAYKHVPMVERNITEGVKNNILGTNIVATCAAKHNVGHFVLVSTDKAVRPTNVMGASKRCAELVIQALALEFEGTVFSIVRFGNVLGSSGSVVPLFKEQIKQNGPITVTHPDIIRYFMTIPEAAQLVIQAGALSESGDVFVLDMGEPVKIVELAKKMIHLMGKKLKTESGEDGIEIQYTGLRPGEKLFEELLIGEDVTGTEHARILKAKEQCLSPEEMSTLLLEVKACVTNRDADKLRDILINAPTGYQPNSELEDSLWKARNRVAKEKMSLH